MRHAYWSTSSFLLNIIKIYLRVSKLWSSQECIYRRPDTMLIAISPKAICRGIKLSSTKRKCAFGSCVDSCLHMPQDTFLHGATSVMDRWIFVQCEVFLIFGISRQQIFLFSQNMAWHFTQIVSQETIFMKCQALGSMFWGKSYWNIISQIHDMIFHPVTFYWHLDDQF